MLNEAYGAVYRFLIKEGEDFIDVGPNFDEAVYEAANEVHIALTEIFKGRVELGPFEA